MFRHMTVGMSCLSVETQGDCNDVAIAFLAFVDVCLIQSVSCSLAGCFVRDSLGDMNLSVQEYVI